MLKVRVIPCLDVNRGRVVKGVRFVDLVDAGDPVEQARVYDRAGADELCFLDITASHENRDTIYDVVARTGREQQLGRVGREADDAARGGGQRHRVAGTVADGDRSPRRRARRGNRGRRRVRIRPDRADRGCHSGRRQREQDQHDEGASGVHGCQRSPA